MSHIIIIALSMLNVFYRVFNINTKTAATMRYMKNVSKKEYYKMLLKYRVFVPIIYVSAFPLAVIYFVLKRLGVAPKLQQKEIARENLKNKVTTKLHCSNVTEYPASWIGNSCAGYYRAGRIIVNAKIKGVDLVDTLFHEDRHYQQEQRNRNCFKGYIKAEDDYRGYIRQHVEKDARRYAYVQTMRYAKEIMSPIKFILFAPLYRLRSHPWRGIVLKKYRTEIQS